MERVDVYFGLGSNQGDRAGNIRQAVALMDEAFGRHKALSALLETEAWGFQGPPFLNACVRYRIPRKGSPQEHATEILHQVKALEKALGRADEPHFDAQGKRLYQDRPIDIDILYYGKQTINTEDLTIPHPRIVERDFVLVPLREVAKQELKRSFPEINA